MSIIKGKAATPAHDWLFEIRDNKDAKKLSKEQALVFHHMVVQLLFITTRVR
jgi:hypothetical protein